MIDKIYNKSLLLYIFILILIHSTIPEGVAHGDIESKIYEFKCYCSMFEHFIERVYHSLNIINNIRNF